MCASQLTLFSKPEPCTKLADASDAADFTVNDVPHSIVLLKETNPLSAAFERACLDRPEDQKVALRKAQGLHELFEQLERSNQKSSEESAFRRGVKRLTPTIGVIGGSMGFVGSLTALDPVANNAFGIVQSVMTVRRVASHIAIASTDSLCYRSLSESVVQKCSSRNMSKPFYKELLSSKDAMKFGTLRDPEVRTFSR